MTERDPRTPFPDSRDEDDRSDIKQIAEARKDAVKRGEGGDEPETFTAPGMPDGTRGTGGVVTNQDDDAQ